MRMQPEKIYVRFRFLAGLAWGTTGLTYVLFLQRTLKLSLGQIELLSVPYLVSHLFLQIPTGMWADKFGRARSMRVALVMYALTSFGYLLAYRPSGASTVFAITAELLWGVADAFLTGADEAWLRRALEIRQAGKQLGRVIGRAVSWQAVGTFIGGSIGAATFMVNLRLVWLLRGALFVLAWLYVKRHMRDEGASSGVASKSPLCFLPSLRRACTSWLLLWPILLLCLTELLTPFYHFWTPFTLERFGLRSVMGLWILNQSMTYLAGKAYQRYEARMGAEGSARRALPLMSGMYFLQIGVMLVCSTYLELPAFFALYAGLQIGREWFYPTLRLHALRHVDERMSATYLSLQATFGVIACLPVLVGIWWFTRGLESNAASIALIWQACAAIGLAGGLVLWLFRPRPTFAPSLTAIEPSA